MMGQSPTLPDRVMYWKTPSASAVRQGDWKLIQHRRSDRVELFQLKDDPLEETDLAAEQPAKVSKLSALLETLAVEDQ